MLTSLGGSRSRLPHARGIRSKQPYGYRGQHDCSRDFAEQRGRGADEQIAAAVRAQHVEPGIGQQQGAGKDGRW
jgi:hypothetical protein